MPQPNHSAIGTAAISHGTQKAVWLIPVWITAASAWRSCTIPVIVARATWRLVCSFSTAAAVVAWR